MRPKTIPLLLACLVWTTAPGVANHAWTAHQLPGASLPIREIEFADNRFVAIGSDMTLYHSRDGKSWFPGLVTAAPDFTVDPLSDLTGIAYGNGWWVILGTKVAKEIMLRSQDGINWTASEPNLPRPRRVVFGNSLFYATDTFDDGVFTSSDGATWQKVLSTPSNSVVVIPGPSGFAVALEAGKMHYSSTLATLQGFANPLRLRI